METLASLMIASETDVSISSHLSPQLKYGQKFFSAACFKISGFLVSLVILMGASAAMAQTLLKLGDSGPQVTELQQQLTQEGCYSGPITGAFGELTEEGVKQCQIKYGLEPDGIVGAQTSAALFRGGNPTPTYPTTTDATATYYNPPTYGQVLRNGDAGDAVARIQQQLSALGFYRGAMDGYFGIDTELAVRDFQRSRGLLEDGIVGDQVYQALNGTIPPVTPPIVDRPLPEGLTYGDRGERVQELQRRLTASGYPVVEDGIYGDETARAVRLFQQERRLPITGRADVRTLEALGIVASGIAKNRYIVIVPNQDATTLPQVRQVLPEAQLKTDRRGDYVLAGAYTTPEQATVWSDRLRARGLDARVVFQ